MTIFDRLFKNNGFPVLINQFGECVTYCKFDGTQRTVAAIVNRDPPTAIDAVEYAITEEIVISVYNCEDSGISSTEIDVGGDSILVSKRNGKPPVRMAVAVLEDDSGRTCVIRLR